MSAMQSLKAVLIPGATYGEVAFIVKVGTTEPITDANEIGRCLLDAIAEQLTGSVIHGANEGFISEISVDVQEPNP